MGFMKWLPIFQEGKFIRSCFLLKFFAIFPMIEIVKFGIPTLGNVLGLKKIEEKRYVNVAAAFLLSDLVRILSHVSFRCC